MPSWTIALLLIFFVVREAKSQEIICKRKSYAISAIKTLPLILRSVYIDSDFLKLLTSEERKQLILMLGLISEKKHAAQEGFHGGSILELQDRFGLKVEFSDRPEDFILSPGEPERSAKTTRVWEDPIIFNQRYLDGPAQALDFLDILQLSLHEFGHKLGDQKNQMSIDSLASKIRQNLNKYYMKSNTVGGYQLEMLSFPTSISGKSFSTDQFFSGRGANYELSFISDRQGMTKHLSESMAEELRRQFNALKTIILGSQNIENIGEVRVAQIKLNQLEERYFKVTLEIDFLSRVGFQGPEIKSLAHLPGGEILSAPVITDVLPVENKRFEIHFNARIVSGWGKDPLNDWELNSGPGEVVALPQNHGVAKNFNFFFDASDPLSLKIRTESDFPETQPFSVLSIRSGILRFHLFKHSEKIEGNKIIRTYFKDFSPQTQSQDFSIDRVLSLDGGHALLLARPQIFTAGFKLPAGPRSKVSIIGTSYALSKTSGEQWEEIDPRKIQMVSTSCPQFKVDLAGSSKIIEVRLIWKKGLELINSEGQVIGINAVTDTEILSLGKFVQEFSGENSSISFFSERFNQPENRVALIKDFTTKDNGFREIKEIVLIAEDLSFEVVREQSFYNQFYTEEGMRIPLSFLGQGQGHLCDQFAKYN